MKMNVDNVDVNKKQENKDNSNPLDNFSDKELKEAGYSREFLENQVKGGDSNNESE